MDFALCQLLWMDRLLPVPCELLQIRYWLSSGKGE